VNGVGTSTSKVIEKRELDDALVPAGWELTKLKPLSENRSAERLDVWEAETPDPETVWSAPSDP
jgi:hypothetical protein